MVGDRPCSGWRIGAIALTAGAIAGLVSWITCEWAHDVFRPRLVEAPQWEAIWMVATDESRYAAYLKNAALAFAVLGCTAGFAMGFAGGIAAGLRSRGLFVGLVAQAAGLLVGALAALALIPLFHPVTPPPVRSLTTEMWFPVTIRAGIWAAIGAVGGGAFAIGMGRKSHLGSALGTGIASALLAALCFHLIGTCVPPESRPSDPIALTPAVRLVAMLVPALMIAAGAALGTVGLEPTGGRQ